MRSPPFHPDQLSPGSVVGPWNVVASLGAGGFGRVFKVERGGRFYTMKMALRPAGPQVSEEEDVNGRLSHEVATLLACAPHPNLPRVHAVDRWPEPPEGYLFFVTDFIDGETFHEWRWRVKPSAAHLLSVFTEVVRAVSDLHRRGLHHRDVKGDNLLIRREDERPFLIDLGTVRMPGATTLTVGVAPASPHLLPPECVAFLREGQWEQGARFDAGIPGDLYALGALLYESLTDGYAFDPRLPYDRLLPAIETVTPRAPHVVNPKVPPALGDIALRLLAKRPEERYAGTEALLQALWEVAKEKRQPAWKVSLDRPPDPESPRDVEADTPRVRMVPELVRSSESHPHTPEPEESRPPEESVAEALLVAPLVEDSVAAGSEVVTPVESPRAERTPARRSRGWTIGVGVVALLVICFAAVGLARREPSPSSMQAVVPPPPPAEKGSSVVTSRPPHTPVTAASSSPPRVVEVTPEAPLQAPVLKVERAVEATNEVSPSARKRSSVSSTLGKTAAVACLAGACAGGAPQVRTTSPEQECPQSTIEVMTKMGWKLPSVVTDGRLWLIPRFDGRRLIPVPPEGPITAYAAEKPILGYGGVVDDAGDPIAFPVGTRFQGTLFHGKERYFGWFTEAELPDGRRVPLCLQITWYGRKELGVPYDPSSTPELKLTEPQLTVTATRYLGRL
ncbi:serine/threonine-protein kinase [Myxococcus sp. CA039A]|uniref:serine/threonine protein kinase n=1 Tax=Myxococcus sp. CA039A TaxID=2741737 RepID=UPI00157B707D|nr:serine/threonine protein kinase [Myxococcus sp. CA039A]